MKPIIFIVIAIIFISSSCKKDENITLPKVETLSITDITGTTAVSGGNIIDDGGGLIIARGVCWSTYQNPIVTKRHTSDGTGNGKFTSTITGLTDFTEHYVRAYATNNAGTAYGQELSFISEYGSLSDIDGNVYKTVKIGNQVWMAENLKTTKFNDGTAIPLVIDQTEWVSMATPDYCWFNNDSTANKATYGALYNWYTVNTTKLCPTGWHVPTDEEWTVLTDNLGGSDLAGGKLKEAGFAHWHEPNTSATNESNFTALPGGERYKDGKFYGIGSSGVWWSSSFYHTNYVWRRFMDSSSSKVYRDTGGREMGHSVRCVKGY